MLRILASPVHDRMAMRGVCVALSAFVASTGCGRQDVIQQAGHSRLAAIASTWNDYQVAHQGQLPVDEEELRKFLAGHHSLPQLLKNAGVSTVDELFVSERDAQPYVLFFGEETNQFEGGIMGYERQGVDGQRIVGYRGGYVNVLDEARFQELMTQP